jgi:hypothetical protein
MSQEREFDNAFKERLGNMDFEFKDAYWTEMSALMDGKKKKRGLLFWWISTGSVAAILLLVGLVYFTRNESQKQWAGFVHDGASTEQNTQENENFPSAEPTLDANKTEQAQESEVLEKNNAVQRNLDNHTQNRNASSSNSGNDATTNPRNNNSNANNTHDNVLSALNPIISNANNNENNENLRNENQQANNNAQNPTSVVETHENQSAHNNYLSQENEYLNLNRMPLLATLPLYENKSDLADFAQDEIKQTSSIRSHVGIVAGTNFSRSFETQDGAVGGLGSHLGLRFYFSGRRGFQVNTGLSFGVNQIKGLVYEEHRKIYGYNEYDVVNTIKYSSMLTANVPIYLGYEGYRFAFAGGVRLNYIMNTKGRVYTWDNSVVDQNIWGYANGIKYFNMALGFEATCHIARRWDVGISLDLDLSSRSEENNDLISPEARLWQTGVFLKYRIN